MTLSTDNWLDASPPPPLDDSDEEHDLRDEADDFEDDLRADVRTQLRLESHTKPNPIPHFPPVR